MYCNKCGTFLPDGARFCSNCGAETAAEAPQYGQTEGYYPAANNQGVSAAAEEDAKPVLVWGILGLVFALTINFLGIIFSAIGLSKAKKYAAKYGELTGKAKVGRGLSIGGLVSGIVFTVLSVLMIIGLVFAISQGEFLYY